MIEKIESEWVSVGAGCREATQGWIPSIVENLPLVSSLPSSWPRVVEFERTHTVSPGLIFLIFPNLFPQLFQRTQKWPAGIWKLSFSTSGTTEQLIGFSVVFYRWVDSCQVLLCAWLRAARAVRMVLRALQEGVLPWGFAVWSGGQFHWQSQEKGF